MSRVVQFNRYGGPEVLEIVDVPEPVPASHEIVVRVVTAALNPVENHVREGGFDPDVLEPFPQGNGLDFAGRIVSVGSGVTRWVVGDDVVAWAPRRAHADHVVMFEHRVARKPEGVDWLQAAAIAGVAASAWASVEAVNPAAGETVVISAAAGGVGAIATQLVLARGAAVIGTASIDSFGYLHQLGAVPVEYGDGVLDRIRAAAPDGVDAYLDNFGFGNVDIALALGVAPSRINTVREGGASRTHGTHFAAQAQGNSPAVWDALGELMAKGQLVIPIAGTYTLDNLVEAYEDVATRHGVGKRVLLFAEDFGDSL